MPARRASRPPTSARRRRSTTASSPAARRSRARCAIPCSRSAAPSPRARRWSIPSSCPARSSSAARGSPTPSSARTSAWARTPASALARGGAAGGVGHYGRRPRGAGRGGPHAQGEPDAQPRRKGDSTMNGLHGIIFSYEQEPGLRELAERRMPASIPFGGRYRVVDFMLSNLHAAGITDVGVVLHGNYQSLLDHIGNGKTWDMARKYGGLRILPPFADTRAYRSGEFRGKMEALAGVRSYSPGIRQDYVVLSDSDLIYHQSAARGRVCRASGERRGHHRRLHGERRLRGQRDLPHARERRRDRAGLVRADRAARPPLAGDLHSQQAAAAHARGRVLRAG